MENPSISVIIPLYNAREYIGKCLDSLLAQTFQNFEIIVVNDRSIDRSTKIVKVYEKKFVNRLGLAETEKNSGGSGYVPRNIGLNLAVGEYVFFLDADDLLSENALETLYNAAKENAADVVYTSAYNELSKSKEIQVISDAKAEEMSTEGVDDKGISITDAPDKNLKRLFSGEDFRTAWTKFVRRDLLTKNEIVFPETIIGGDYIWSMNVYCHAKKFLRLNVPVYFRRNYSASFVARKNRKPEDKVSFWVSAFVVWFQAFNEFASKNEFLNKDSAQYYEISSDYFNYCLSQISNETVNRFYSKEIYDILLREFAKKEDKVALTVPFFFSAIASQEKNAAKTQKQVKELEGAVTRQKEQINSLTTGANHVKELTAEITRQKKQIDSLTANANRATALEIELVRQKKLIDSLTAGANRATVLENELVKQRELINSLTVGAGRATVLENELVKQKKLIDSLTANANRATALESELAKQKKLIDSLTANANRAKELESELAKKKEQFSLLTAGAEYVKVLEGELTQQREQIDFLTVRAERAKALENELTQQKEQIDSLTARLNRAKVLENEVTRQKNQVGSFSVTLCPAVSIIIPMYNAQDFVGEALESILVQTLQNFEVIVVDDCSKDESYKVVESYIPKFDGRLRLLSMGKNSGAAPAPRNKGFLFSRGEYVFFMDVDDTITKTALEEMYTLAKEYEADVVYCEKYFMSTGVGQEFINNIHPADNLIQSGGFVDKPTLISNDIAERLRDLKKQRFWVTPWQRLVSRELLAENKITFPEIIGSDDVLWCYTVLCSAKRFLRVPNSCYVRRMSDESFTKSKKAPNKHLRQWLDMIIRGLKFADNFMDRIEFFRDNPTYRYEGLLCLSRASFNNQTYSVCKTLPPGELYDIFITEFSKHTGESNVTVASLLVRIFENNKTLSKTQQKLKAAEDTVQESKKHIAELEAEIKRLKSDNRNFKSSSQLVPFQSTGDLAISVIVSMYNAEKFIGECLDSLLAQTFRDFEVIVVDDCSTDKSIDTVKNYAPKFNGHLKLAKVEKHSPGDGLSQNIGLKLANGEFVFFMEAADYLAEDALKTLYTAAKEYETDVVYTAAYYRLDSENKVVVFKDDKGKKLFKEGVEDKAILNTEPDKNLNMLIFDKGFAAPWTKFIRREFLIKNEIVFPETATDGDYIWTVKLYCHAKSVLRLPDPVYFYRNYNARKVLPAKQTSSEKVSFAVSAFVEWLKVFNNLSSEIEILKNNPAYCHEASKRAFERLLKRLTEDLNTPAGKEIYEALYRELGKEKDLSAFVMPFLFGATNTAKKNRRENPKKPAEQVK